MSRFDSEKLYVTFYPKTTPSAPLNNRHYTLTHSDETGTLFLAIGLNYAYEKITSMRDEVLAKWCCHEDRCFLLVNVHVDSEPVKNLTDSMRRNSIFCKELPLALTAFHYGDQMLFKCYPYLKHAPIFIHFESKFSCLCRNEFWGTFANYCYCQ